MTSDIKQSNIDKNTSKAGPNRAGLFIRALGSNLLVKLERGHDFYSDKRGSRGRVLSYTASEPKSEQDSSYNRFSH